MDLGEAAKAAYPIAKLRYELQNMLLKNIVFNMKMPIYALNNNQRGIYDSFFNSVSVNIKPEWRSVLIMFIMLLFYANYMLFPFRKDMSPYYQDA